MINASKSAYSIYVAYLQSLLIGVNKVKPLQTKQLDFLEAVGINQLVHMYDLLPDTMFWIKNDKSEIIYANSTFIETIGVGKLENLVGKTDHSFAPLHLAKQYMLDDKKVMAGDFITDRLELNFSSTKNKPKNTSSQVGSYTGHYSWYSTTKRPLFDNNKRIIGSYGFTRHLEYSAQGTTSLQAIEVPVNYIREHFRDDLSIEQLANLAFLSVSALERRFKKYLHKTPKQFLNEVRLEHARKMLIDTQLPILDIALSCGYSDHSYFSGQFKALFGMLPSKLRKQAIDLQD